MITILSGTNREGSNTLAVARLVDSYLRELGRETTLLDLRELPPGLFTPGAYAEKPEAFKRFTDAVLSSEGLVVVSPEYNGGFPGVLKYFIDMLPFPESFQDRPVCFVGLSAGQWGALRPVEQLQQIFGYRNAHIFPRRTFLPGIGGLLDEEGNLTDADSAERLKQQAAGYVKFLDQLHR